MMKTNCTGTWMATLAIAALLSIGLGPQSTQAQTDPVADSIQQADARKAMEAEADSARRAADNVAERVRAAQLRDDTARTEAPPAADTGAPTVADTTIRLTAPATTGQPERIPGSDTTVAPPPTTAPGDTVPVDTSIAVPEGDTAQVAQTTPTKPVDPTAPYKDITFAPDEKPIVIFETSAGTISFELWPDVALKHCQNFVYLINEGFYDSLLFHRVVPGFLIQGGDPTGTGTGGPGYTLPAEFSTTIKHDEGILSMARKTDPQAKPGEAERPEFLNSAGSQFFICLGRTASLDGKYTAFGEVIEGMDVVQKIAKVEAQRERPLVPVRITRAYVKPKA